MDEWEMTWPKSHKLTAKIHQPGQKVLAFEAKSFEMKPKSQQGADAGAAPRAKGHKPKAKSRQHNQKACKASMNGR